MKLLNTFGEVGGYLREALSSIMGLASGYRLRYYRYCSSPNPQNQLGV
jgi:hypothetical protein